MTPPADRGGDMDKLIELTGQSQIPVDVWIDDDQRIRDRHAHTGAGAGAELTVAAM
jgi:hypothetical protein